MLRLRGYQQEAVDNLIKIFQTDSFASVLLCLPTGSGKTVVFSEFIARTGLSDSVVLTHRQELKQQAERHALDAAMVLRFLKSFTDNPPPVVVCDEAHRGEFIALYKKHKEKRNFFLLGVTATPVFSGSRHSMSYFFDHFVEPVTIAELIGAGYLCKTMHYVPSPNKEGVLRLRGTDYDVEQQKAYIRGSEGITNIIKLYERYAFGKQAIIFCPSVDFSVEVSEAFRAAGYSCFHIDGKTPEKDRATLVRDFCNGRLQLLTNVDILTTGFDYPALDTIILARKTASRSLYFQMLGRGTRVYPGKEYLTVIDLGNNGLEHGPLEACGSWEKYFYKEKKKDKGPVPVKYCPSCHRLVVIQATQCACGYTFVTKKKPQKGKIIDGELSLLSGESYAKITRSQWSGIPYSELDEVAGRLGYRRGWIFYRLAERDDNTIRAYARLHGMHPERFLWFIRKRIKTKSKNR